MLLGCNGHVVLLTIIYGLFSCLGMRTCCLTSITASKVCSLFLLSSASFLATAAVFRQRDKISDWLVNVVEHLAVKAETL